MFTRLESKLSSARPRRGSPEQTRERLVAAAASLFNGVGCHGTDSLAAQRAFNIFLAAYEAWVASEWKAVGTELSHQFPHSFTQEYRSTEYPRSGIFPILGRRGSQFGRRVPEAVHVLPGGQWWNSWRGCW